MMLELEQLKIQLENLNAICLKYFGKNYKSCTHYATILKNFGIEEIREILCTLQAHYVFCMHLWDVIIHI